jgi:exopolysaccharide production protein ExoQ
MVYLASLACLALIGWLFWQDKKLRHFSSSALWIPSIWLAILGSRSPAHWLSSFGLYHSGPVEDASGGNPLDSAFFLGVLLLSIVVLQRRKFAWGRFISQNKILCLIYIYFLCSSLWADYSVPTAKRVTKDFGSVLVALILITDRNPIEAIRMVFVRIAYILLPLSILFIKYFPAIGRVPNRSGSNLFAGVAAHKNTLGFAVFVLGVAVLVDLLALRQSRSVQASRIHEFIRYFVLLIAGWVLLVCDSKTALLCLVLGGALLVFTKKLARFKRPGRVVGIALGSVALILLLEVSFSVSATVLALLGRDPTLTGRTEIWQSVLAAPTNPLIGCGFYSFWSTEMAQPIIEPFGELKTAHNGFIETYLDGGLIGLTLLILFLLGAGWHNVNRVVTGALIGRVGLVFWTVIIIYSISETTFFRQSPLWFALILVAIDYRYPDTTPAVAIHRNAHPAFPAPSPLEARGRSHDRARR